MLKENGISNSPVQTKNEQRRLILRNQSIKLENEEEILKIIKDYLDFNDFTVPIDHVGFLHQEFLEKQEDFKECNPEHLCTLNYHVKELYLLLSRLQLCSSRITTATKMLQVLNPNQA